MLVSIIGFFAGIIGGMGMGGGTILIPALVLLANIDPKLAQSINLISSIPMTIVALFIHVKNKNVEFIADLCIGCTKGCVECIKACPFYKKGYEHVFKKYKKLKAKLS